jgi:Cdc6-like AAA superfamily ATPase
MSNLEINLSDLDYSRLNLTGNPFPYSGIPEQTPEIYVGQEDVLNKISNVLSPVIKYGRSSHLIISGSYGNGKSHTLRYIQSQIKKQFENSEYNKPVVGYIGQPGESMLDIYRDFIYDIGPDYLKGNAQKYIGNCAVQLSREGKIEEKIKNNEGWNSIESGDVLLSDVIPEAMIKLSAKTKFPDFSRAFLNLAYEENSITSWEWISGESIEYSRRREINLTTNIGKRLSQRAFLALKNTLELTDNTPLILLIDEFEYIETLQTKNKQNMLNSIRHLMDLNPFGLSIVMACAPDVWEKIISEYHAFSERIGKEVNLKPLTRENVGEFIVSYLNLKRKLGSDSLGPFTDSAIDKIFVQGQGNARQIITICSNLLDLSIKEGKKIDEDFVNSIL